MQYVTVAESRTSRETFRRQVGGRGEYFQFEYDLRHDPKAEGVRVQFGERLGEACDHTLLPAITQGVSIGFGESASAGLRLCCVDLRILSGTHDEVQNPYPAIRNALRWFVRAVLRTWTAPIPPLRAEWLTSDVVALARGIHANAALDGLPALTDALLEAGCDDPLAIEHLMTCPDHGPMCWVVEMICAQAAARDGTSG